MSSTILGLNNFAIWKAKEYLPKIRGGSSIITCEKSSGRLKEAIKVKTEPSE